MTVQTISTPISSVTQSVKKTATALTSENATYAAGTIVVESDSGKVKIGNGTSAWTSLGYIANVADLDVAAVWGSITGTLSAQTDLGTALGLKAPLASPIFTGSVKVPTYTTGTLPAVVIGAIIYVSNANTNAGTIAFGHGSIWTDVKTGVAVIA